jgi:hypothetical protein
MYSNWLTTSCVYSWIKFFVLQSNSVAEGDETNLKHERIRTSDSKKTKRLSFFYPKYERSNNFRSFIPPRFRTRPMARNKWGISFTPSNSSQYVDKTRSSMHTCPQQVTHVEHIICSTHPPNVLKSRLDEFIVVNARSWIFLPRIISCVAENRIEQSHSSSATIGKNCRSTSRRLITYLIA